MIQYYDYMVNTYKGIILGCYGKIVKKKRFLFPLKLIKKLLTNVIIYK